MQISLMSLVPSLTWEIWVQDEVRESALTFQLSCALQVANTPQSLSVLFVSGRHIKDFIESYKQFDRRNLIRDS